MEDSIIRKILLLKQETEQNRLNKLTCLKQKIEEIYNGTNIQEKTTIGNNIQSDCSIQKTKKKCIL